jgi:hypothetical protein
MMTYPSTPNQALFSLCNQRKNQRYTTSQGTPIELVINDQDICNALKGMITDDSFGGCGLVIFGNQRLCSGQLCFIRIKGLEPIPCKIVWIKSLEKNLFRVGLQYVINEHSSGNLASGVA